MQRTWQHLLASQVQKGGVLWWMRGQYRSIWCRKLRTLFSGMGCWRVALPCYSQLLWNYWIGGRRDRKKIYIIPIKGETSCNHLSKDACNLDIDGFCRFFFFYMNVMASACSVKQESMLFHWELISQWKLLFLLLLISLWRKANTLPFNKGVTYENFTNGFQELECFL